MRKFKIDPIDLLNFPRDPEQEISEWVAGILAAKGIDAGAVTGNHMGADGLIVVECDE